MSTLNKVDMKRVKSDMQRAQALISSIGEDYSEHELENTSYMYEELSSILGCDTKMARRIVSLFHKQANQKIAS